MGVNLKGYNSTLTQLVSNDNSTNESYSDISQAQRTAFLVAFSFIMLFSLAGNSLVLAAVYRNSNHRMRTVSNYFVVNMSSSDLLITLCNVPKAISSIVLNGTWPISGDKGLHLCRVTKLLCFLSIDVSLLSLIAISVNRFLLVFFPLKRFVTPKIALIVILVIWLVSLIFAGSLMPGVVTYLHIAEKPELFCTLRFSDHIGTYLIVHFAVFIVWPLLTMVLLYSAVVFKLRCRKLPGNRSVINQEFNERLNRRVLIMLITVVILFAICWVPFWVVTLPHMRRSLSYSYITECVAYTNCVLNPLIYTIFNEEFRNAFKEILQSLLCPSCLRERQHSLHNQVFVLEPLTSRHNKTYGNTSSAPTDN